MTTTWELWTEDNKGKRVKETIEVPHSDCVKFKLLQELITAIRKKK